MQMQMYDQTEAQKESEKILNKQKFHFSNWISAVVCSRSPAGYAAVNQIISRE